MGLLSDGADFLRDTLLSEDVGGVSVSYSRKVSSTTTTTLTITAMRGRSQLRTTDQDGQSILLITDRDYIFDPTELVFDSVQSEPKRGDRITDGSEVYEVAPYIQGEQHWRKCDESGSLIRVHCRRVT